MQKEHYQSLCRWLSNGRYSVLITPTGNSYALWEQFAINRWTNAWPALQKGCLLYVQNLTDNQTWSIGYQPTQFLPDDYEVMFNQGRYVIRRKDHNILSSTEIHIEAETDREIRQITFHNSGNQPISLVITSFMEVCLQVPAADLAHPAFSKLFVETDFSESYQALLARRRPRSPQESIPWLAQRLSGLSNTFSYETSRANFIGRGYSQKSPRGLGEQTLTKTVGNVLDPIFVLRHQFEIQPTEIRQFMLTTSIAHSQSEALALLNQPLGNKAILKFVPEQHRAQAKPINESIEFGPTQVKFDKVNYQSTFATGKTNLQPNLNSEQLTNGNGLGKFTRDGSEYHINLQRDASGHLVLPPLPWTNVIANETFGTIISETGSSCTWAINSREHRLTPWNNDPVLDETGEAIYLKDKVSGELWSPAPSPLGKAPHYTVQHGKGYSTILSSYLSLKTSLRTLVPREHGLKIVSLKIQNNGKETRHLALTSYFDLMLGADITITGKDIQVTFDATTQSLIAQNPKDVRFANRLTFSHIHVPGFTERPSYTANRDDFTGFLSDLTTPLALLSQDYLSNSIETDGNPCLAIQTAFTIAAGETLECLLLLGEVDSHAEIVALVQKLQLAGASNQAFQEVQSFWQQTTGQIQIQTPLRSMDILVNHWLLYQTISCRLWGRSAFYQSGGAFGFRDQLQDSAALVYARPDLMRAQILLNAAHQFIEGDVLHWWHPHPYEQGIRTRFSDDLLWMPYLTAFYCRTTGDWSIFDEVVAFIEAPLLKSGEDEIFISPVISSQSASLYEHCCRALDRSLTKGAHGLPLMGTGDWNDGMNRVGREGKGESVWVGFFLYSILADFIEITTQRNDSVRTSLYQNYRHELHSTLNTTGWDGEWYRRAYYDNGAPLGSTLSDECQIDALAQSWAVISCAAPEERARKAMQAVEHHLIAKDDGLIKLLNPAFDKTPHDPGYIKGYVPGIRENGGQYTHAALWVIRALAELGEKDLATELFDMITPINLTATPEQVKRYQAEPYVVAADVYGVEPHIGRAGWTWYTGSAGWMYRIALESLLGFSICNGQEIRIKPRVPNAWPHYQIDYQLPNQETRYSIVVHNPQQNYRRISHATLDGQALTIIDDTVVIPLLSDGNSHQVYIALAM